MILIGEKLNSSIPKTLEAILSRDEAAVVGMIRLQEENGARYLDINTAMAGRGEAEAMEWIIGLVKKHSSCGVMLDSSNVGVILNALDRIKGMDVIVNSVTATKRLHELAPAIKAKNASVVCLPIDDTGVPKCPEEIVSLAALTVEKLSGYGIAPASIYIDALVKTLSVEATSAVETLSNIRALKSALPEVKTLCGLSNVSYGLPGRGVLNSAFLGLCMFCGLDCAILDASSQSIRDTLYASQALLGMDEFCMDYIGYIRSKQP